MTQSSAQKNFNASKSNRGDLYSPETRSPGIYQNSGMAHSVSNFFAPGMLDSDERNRKLQSLLDYREAKSALMEKDDAIDHARKKRSITNIAKIQSIQSGNLQVAKRLDVRHD